MSELQIGQVIKSKRVNYRTRRIVASLLVAGFALAATFTLRTGTTTTIRDITPANAGGGGLIRGGSGGGSTSHGVKGGGGGGTISTGG